MANKLNFCTVNRMGHIRTSWSNNMKTTVAATGGCGHLNGN